MPVGMRYSAVRNVFVELGDIVAEVSIKRERFVVLELKESEELQANGRDRAGTERRVRVLPQARKRHAGRRWRGLARDGLFPDGQPA